MIIEKYYRHGRGILTPNQKRSVILSLVKNYRRSSQTWKIVSYGLRSLGSFRYLIGDSFEETPE